MQGPNEESDEGFRGFKINLDGNQVCGGEGCHLVWDTMNSSVPRKEYPQLWEL